MEAIKKQAARLREQVAKQQQAVLKHLGHFGNEAVVVDDAEFQCHQQLQNLYNSTRAAKHFQKHIVRAIEGLLTASSKQMEISRKLAEDCCNYGADTETTNLHLARAVLQFGTSHNLMENERETLHGILGDQVCEPLRALVTGAPLEDARHLTHRYEKLRQEVEAQRAEVLKRRSKTRESDISAENSLKLRNAEARLTELKTTTIALGREATAAMLSVENQQQQITVQRLFTMVDAERCYHQHVLAVLDKLHAEMMLEEQLNNSSSKSMTIHENVSALSPPLHQDATSNGSKDQIHNQKDTFFIAKVIHSFDAQAEGELTLCLGDCVVVRQVAPTGWSEGECNGKAGWFPSAYIEIPEIKISEEQR
ncbi:SH3 domain-containing protein 2-like [Mercurialis annua]|uniref:SH3 domain-containing protein 2-like n=1 Tax=Mercurialis annua TaxID=3986 RepID=UPI002160283A|nr:SH3 domain-containing protein 2-like [Mercurialis annua]